MPIVTKLRQDAAHQDGLLSEVATEVDRWKHLQRVDDANLSQIHQEGQRAAEFRPLASRHGKEEAWLATKGSARVALQLCA